MGLVSLQKERDQNSFSFSLPCEDTMRSGHLKAGEGALTRNKLLELDLDLLTFRTMRKITFYCLSQSVVFCYDSLSN